jgi:hypothetical protein
MTTSNFPFIATPGRSRTPRLNRVAPRPWKAFNSRFPLVRAGRSSPAFCARHCDTDPSNIAAEIRGCSDITHRELPLSKVSRWTRAERAEPPALLVFLPGIESPPVAQSGRPKLNAAARSRQRATTRTPAEAAQPTANPAEVEPEAITPAAAPDWRQEAEIAAGHQLEAGERDRERPSPLAPHEFPEAPPPAREFQWDYAATHRVEGLPEGGFLININDRCVVVVLVMMMPLCRVGKIPARGDLFQHLDDPPRLGESTEP